MTDYSVLPASEVFRKGTSRQVAAEVEFGVIQAQGDCLGVGICRIITTHHTRKPSLPSRRCARASALLEVSDDGRLEIFFPKLCMPPCTEKTFFQKRVFPLPVPFFLPEHIQQLLPELKQIILSAGLYPIRAEASGYRITF
ncbi:MAG: hypothetical protein NZM43_01630 [Saprospiraceae bacterium]|nr:hypothetical protein [Saprospiraceae bacterium]MDW8483001.1 hypothetical protein [Saprospiraceae bacterium]